MSKKPPEQAPVKFCPEKGCGKKMSAFKRGRGWKYICPDDGKHRKEKLEAKQRGPLKGRGGVKKGTPSPKHGKEYPKEPRRKWYWGPEKKKDPRRKK
jgi:hypothetical protein